MEERPRLPKFKILLAFMWAIPITAIAIVMIILVVGIPIGVPLLFVGSWPLYRVIQTHIKHQSVWILRDHPLPNNERKPWEDND